MKFLCNVFNEGSDWTLVHVLFLEGKKKGIQRDVYIRIFSMYADWINQKSAELT